MAWIPYLAREGHQLVAALLKTSELPVLNFMSLVDSHCHLDMLTHDSCDNILQRAKEAGVSYLQTICTRLENFPVILKIAEKYNNVFASVGVHPSEVKTKISAEELVRLAKHDKIIGLGETGLDYYYNKDEAQQQLQREVFAEHIKAAQISGLPIIVHTREAEYDTYELIKAHKKIQEFPGLIHCFTASEDFARKMLNLGFYISVAGIVTFKNATDLQNIVKFIPLDRLLIETDSPYLTPVPHRGQVNEPAYVRYVAEVVADLKGIDFAEVAAQTSRNFALLFNKSLA